MNKEVIKERVLSGFREAFPDKETGINAKTYQDMIVYLNNSVDLAMNEATEYGREFGWRKGFQDGIEATVRKCEDIVTSSRKIIDDVETVKGWVNPIYKHFCKNTLQPNL